MRIRPDRRNDRPNSTVVFGGSDDAGAARAAGGSAGPRSGASALVPTRARARHDEGERAVMIAVDFHQTRGEPGGRAPARGRQTCNRDGRSRPNTRLGCAALAPHVPSNGLRTTRLERAEAREANTGEGRVSHSRVLGRPTCAARSCTRAGRGGG